MEREKQKRRKAEEKRLRRMERKAGQAKEDMAPVHETSTDLETNQDDQERDVSDD